MDLFIVSGSRNFIFSVPPLLVVFRSKDSILSGARMSPVFLILVYVVVLCAIFSIRTRIYLRVVFCPRHLVVSVPPFFVIIGSKETVFSWTGMGSVFSCDIIVLCAKDPVFSCMYLYLISFLVLVFIIIIGCAEGSVFSWIDLSVVLVSRQPVSAVPPQFVIVGIKDTIWSRTFIFIGTVKPVIIFCSKCLIHTGEYLFSGAADVKIVRSSIGPVASWIDPPVVVGSRLSVQSVGIIFIVFCIIASVRSRPAVRAVSQVLKLKLPVCDQTDVLQILINAFFCHAASAFFMEPSQETIIFFYRNRQLAYGFIVKYFFFFYLAGAAVRRECDLIFCIFPLGVKVDRLVLSLRKVHNLLAVCQALSLSVFL